MPPNGPIRESGADAVRFLHVMPTEPVTADTAPVSRPKSIDRDGGMFMNESQHVSPAER